MAWGLGSVLVSFLAISAAILAVRMVWPEVVAPFGVPSVLAFLVTATAVSLRGPA